MTTTRRPPADGAPAAPVRKQRRTPAHPFLEGVRRQDCVRLLEPGGIGRIAYEWAGQLVVVPVNFCWSGHAIVFRTAADSAIAQYGVEPAAFEVDQLDAELQQGWSVLVNGRARPATEDEAAAAEGLVEPWAGGDRAVYVVIEPDQISGRRIRTS